MKRYSTEEILKCRQDLVDAWKKLGVYLEYQENTHIGFSCRGFDDDAKFNFTNMRGNSYGEDIIRIMDYVEKYFD